MTVPDALDKHFLGPSFRAREHGATAPGLLWFSRAGDHVAKNGEEDEIPAASPSQSLLLCGARAPGSLRSRRLPLRPLAPGADEAGIGRLRLRHGGPLSIAESLDTVVLRPPGRVAPTTGRHAGLDLHRPASSSPNQPQRACPGN